jgi:hypothetical protein
MAARDSSAKLRKNKTEIARSRLKLRERFVLGGAFRLFGNAVP